MMKYLLFAAVLMAAPMISFSQSVFPDQWQGNWGGELLWYSEAGREPKKVMMELRIQRRDTGWTWQLIYGSPNEDNRPYRLFAVDTGKSHWAIDEQNGIVLDQFFLAGRLSGAFTVGNSTIFNSYEMRGDSMIVEFNSLQAKALNSSGKGTEDSPRVESYRVKGFQRAVLRRKRVDGQ